MIRLTHFSIDWVVLLKLSIGVDVLPIPMFIIGIPASATRASAGTLPKGHFASCYKAFLRSGTG